MEETSGPTRLLLAAIATGQFLKRVGTTIAGATLAAVASSGAYSDLSGTPSALPPNGIAGGDLTGSYPNPGVQAINGQKIASLANGILTNVLGVPSVILQPTGAVVGTSDVQTLTNKSIAASEVNSGTLAAAQMPALTGDVTTPVGTVATTLATVNTVTPGSYPSSAARVPTLTVNGKGLVTASGDEAINGVPYANITGTPSSLPPNGPAGGDLTGSYPSPGVAKVNGGSVPANAVLISNTSNQIIAEPSTFDVAAYGAVGDGSTSDNTAFVNAFAAAVTYSNNTNKRCKIRIPAGTFRLTSLLSATFSKWAGFDIEGAGPGATVLIWDSAVAGNSGITLTLNASQGAMPNASPFKIRGICFVTQGNAVDDCLTITGLPDVLYTQAPFSYIEDCSWSAYTTGGTLFKHAIVFSNPQWVIFSGLIVNSKAGIQCNITASQSLDGLWFKDSYFINTGGYCREFTNANTGFQSVRIMDCLFISNTDCIHADMGGGVGGAEDWVIRGNYLLTNGGTSAYCLSVVNFTGNIMVHDNFFDYAAGEAGCIYMNAGERHNIYDNFFAGAGGTETAININNVSSCKIHHNHFSNFAHDITVGTNGSDIWSDNNEFKNGSSSNYSRAPVLSDAGFRNLWADIPVAVGALPAFGNAPVGFRAIVNNALGPAFGVTVVTGGLVTVPVYNDGASWKVG